MLRRYKQITLLRRQFISRAMKQRNLTNKFLELGEISQLIQVLEVILSEKRVERSDVEIWQKVEQLRQINDYYFETLHITLREIQTENLEKGLNGLKIVLNKCDYAYYETLASVL